MVEILSLLQNSENCYLYFWAKRPGKICDKQYNPVTKKVKKKIELSNHFAKPLSEKV